MVAPASCIWTPARSERDSRRCGLNEGHMQARLDKRGAGWTEDELQTVTSGMSPGGTARPLDQS